MYSLNILKTFCITSLGSLRFIKKRQLWMNCWIAPHIIGLSKIIMQKIENKNKFLQTIWFMSLQKNWVIQYHILVEMPRWDCRSERACTWWRGEFLFAYTRRLFCTQSGSFPPFFFVKKKKSFFVFHLVFYLYFIGSDVWNTLFFFCLSC